MTPASAAPAETLEVSLKMGLPIDLRSDTVTRPTAEMRAAMAQAEVGDDVYSEDPTINLLEERAAQAFGREAALFVPTGTMGNQIAIRVHTTHGQEVLCESRAHILDWEMGMVAAFSGCLLRAEDGILRWEQIKTLIGPKIYYRQQPGLISLENTHNMAGGIVTPLYVLEEIWAGARAAGLPVHLDGARVFHAATFLGISVAELTRGFDSVMFCLSKGLCAPVGSLLVGSTEFIRKARSPGRDSGGCGVDRAGADARAARPRSRECTAACGRGGGCAAGRAQSQECPDQYRDLHAARGPRCECRGSSVEAAGRPRERDRAAQHPICHASRREP
jgi:threonine aldolase